MDAVWPVTREGASGRHLAVRVDDRIMLAKVPSGAAAVIFWILPIALALAAYRFVLDSDVPAGVTGILLLAAIFVASFGAATLAERAYVRLAAKRFEDPARPVPPGALAIPGAATMKVTDGPRQALVRWTWDGGQESLRVRKGAAAERFLRRDAAAPDEHGEEE